MFEHICDTWIDPEILLPEDKQHCELIVGLAFLSINGFESKKVVKVTEEKMCEGIYNKEKGNWILVNELVSSGSISNRIIKWRPKEVL